MQIVLHHEAVDDAEAVRLHGVSRAVVEVAHIRVVEVGDAFLHRGRLHGSWTGRNRG